MVADEIVVVARCWLLTGAWCATTVLRVVVVTAACCWLPSWLVGGGR